MVNQQVYLSHLLSRTNLSVPFKELIKVVKTKYSITVNDYSPILEGYEDANIKLFTNIGEVVLKIFTNERSNENIRSYIKVLTEGRKHGVPFPELIEGKEGHLSTILSEQEVFFCVTKFFDGQNFEKSIPQDEDFLSVAHYLSVLNALSFPVTGLYDSWGNKNLVRQYDEYKVHLSDEINSLVSPIVEEMAVFDDTRLEKVVIHGDLQRKHVLKSKTGEYCIIDLGCMRMDAKIYDVSILLAWFCLGPDTWDKREYIVHLVLQEYSKMHALQHDELISLSLLVKASYAAYLQKTASLIATGDTSDETKDWFAISKEMLKRMNSWNWKI